MKAASSLKRWFTDIDVLEPAGEGALRVFGLRHPSSGGLTYLTLDEALDTEAFQITEADGDGSVPTLQVTNENDSMVFLMAGEELIGAKQNRVLNVSLMVEGNSAIPVPVSCVEAGRWIHKTAMFSSAKSSSHSKLRAKMANSVENSYRRTGRPASNQEEVWDEVSSLLCCTKSDSPTEALHQVDEDKERDLKAFAETIPPPSGCCGAAFAVAGKIVGVDVFDQPSTLAKLWPKLIRSYAVDALETSTPHTAVRRETVATWLRQAIDAKAERYHSPGAGDDLRFKSDDRVGGSLLVDDQPVHTELFAKGGVNNSRFSSFFGSSSILKRALQLFLFDSSSSSSIRRRTGVAEKDRQPRNRAPPRSSPAVRSCRHTCLWRRSFPEDEDEDEKENTTHLTHPDPVAP